MPIRVVDAHIHLWQLDGPLRYDFLEPEDDPLLGPTAELRITTWDGARFLREARHVDLVAAVHVQASGPGDPVDETRWVAAQHDAWGVPGAIVARADLRAADIGDVLDAHLEASPLVRGVRDLASGGHLDDPALDRGLTALADRGLSWDVHCFHAEAAVVRAAARRHPELTVLLTHAGFPLARTDEYRAAWAQGVREVAAAPNAHVKISGLGMGDHEWTVDSWRPWVRECLEAFGPQRCLVGSNFPVDRLYASYDAVMGAFAELTSDLTAAERAAVLCDNALARYRIDVGAG